MKVGIVTINDFNNYGNRLQNYAVQEVLKKLGNDAITLRNIPLLNTKKMFAFRYLKYLLLNKNKKEVSERDKCFSEFNKNIKFNKKLVTPYSSLAKKFDYFVVGSDQVWKPTYNRMRDVDFLSFAKNEQKIALSASFGISKLSPQEEKFAKKYLENFKAISVRENSGKEIVEKLTKRKDIKLLVDPTMLLSKEEWQKVSKKPKMLEDNKYILCYFLGNLSLKRKQEIQKFADKNNCTIINLLDKNDPFYNTGPSEFLYLEQNAFMICTDSFHSSVFALIFNRPLLIFKREDDKVDMTSRIDTLVEKFNLNDRVYNGIINEKNLKLYSEETFNLLNQEQKIALSFLKDNLN